MKTISRPKTKNQSVWKKLIMGSPVTSILEKTGIKKLFQPFQGSERFWEQRYSTGGTSGPGSYNHLAQFKAEILNQFVRQNSISRVIEYGCGDGNQLKLAEYPNYLGFDISSAAIAICREAFRNDETKQFKLMQEYSGETAPLTLSLDVIYHLVEDEIFNAYMDRLFSSSERFVILYSSNTDINPPGLAPHVRHRNFTKWIEANQPSWQLIQYIPNRYPLKNDQSKESFSDFYIFEKDLSKSNGSR
jgi:SAM-dependent methyltransferase